MDCSTPGLPVPHHLLEFAQVHVHCIGDTIQPSQPLSPFSLSNFNLSQHQGLFQWVSSLHQLAQVLELRFTISPSKEYSGWFPLGWTGWILLPKNSQESSPALQSESINSSPLSLLYGPALTTIHDYWKDHRLTIRTFVGKLISLLFNTLSRFVIAFLPRSNRLLIL